jgi:hypothetical protein
MKLEIQEKLELRGRLEPQGRETLHLKQGPFG